MKNAIEQGERFLFRFHVERLFRGWTQRRLSRLTGISSKDLSRAERGRVNLRPEELERLSAVFRIQPASVLATKIGPSIFVDGRVVREAEAEAEAEALEVVG